MNKSIKIIEIHSKSTHCNGGSDIAGHPLIYLEISDKNEVSCPYCSIIFKYIEQE